MKTGNGTDVRCASCGSEVRDISSHLDPKTGQLVEVYCCRDQLGRACERITYVATANAEMAKYEVTREPAGDGTLYVVRNGAGKVLSLPMALSAARERAYDYEMEDKYNEDLERACAELDD